MQFCRQGGQEPGPLRAVGRPDGRQCTFDRRDPVLVDRADVAEQPLTALRVAAVVVVVLVASWAVLILLAGRLPPGLAKDLSGFRPACVTTARRLRRDPRVPPRAKVAVAVAGLWVLSPIDLIPEFLPVIGPLDDVVVVALALRYAARQVPRAALEEAWAGEPRLLDRLLGAARS